MLIHVPNKKSYTKGVNVKQLGKIKDFARLAHREAMDGNYWSALTLNGLAYSFAFGYDQAPARAALEAGAVAAGLSGKGPATAAVVAPRRLDSVLSALHSFPGRIIETSINTKKSRVMKVEG